MNDLFPKKLQSLGYERGKLKTCQCIKRRAGYLFVSNFKKIRIKDEFFVGQGFILALFSPFDNPNSLIFRG